MEVRIKKLSSLAKNPTYAHPTDACFDLYACSAETDGHGNIVYGTGLAFEIPEGHYLQLQPRSSNTKRGMLLLNTPGIVDSGYRGEVMFKYRPLDGSEPYQIGERIGQGVVLEYPHIEFIETETLSDTERGTGGYGSTGK